LAKSQNSGKIPLRGKNPRKCTYSVPARRRLKLVQFCWPPVSDVAAVTKPRQETHCHSLGCPKQPNRSQSLVGRSSPCCEDMWGRYCCLTSFFPIVDTCLSCEDTARQRCATVPRWRFFGGFLRPVLSASRVQHVSDLHLKFALRPHHVWKYGIHPVCDG